MARRVGTAPTSSGFGDPCIACLPPPYWEIFSVLPFKDTETVIPLYTLPRLHHLLPCSAPLNGRSASLRGDLPNKERTPLPRTGWSVGHSITGVAPAGISRRMFRCLWHTSRGSRFVMSKMGKDFPHPSSRRRNIAYSMAASVDIRKEGANLCAGLALASLNDSSGSQLGWPCPGVR